MGRVRLWLSLFFAIVAGAAQAQNVIPLLQKGGLHAAYVVPTDTFDRVDVQLIVLSGSYDDPNPSGTAHLTEHLAAFSADSTVLRRPRERDIYATTYNVSTVYTNSGAPSEAELLLRLSRAVLDTPDLPPAFAKSEVDIVQRETLLRERHVPLRWLRRKVLQNLYGTLRGRANNTIGDLPNLSLEKAYEFHKTHYAPSNVTLIISGKIDPKEAAELVARIFGDTERSKPPAKPWLDHKPDPALRAVEYLETDRLTRDTVMFVKFIDFADHETSIAMQGQFFLVTGILQDRLLKTLYYEDERFLHISLDWYFAKNADLELSITTQLMPGFGLDDAHDSVKRALDTLLGEPISAKEIFDARQRQAVRSENAARRPTSFLSYLSNVASDGFPPVTPSRQAAMIKNTTDQQVRDFADTIVKPGATSVVLAKRVD